LQELVAGGQLTLLSGTSARRVIVERDGRASGILCQRMNETEPFELPARAIVIAANAFETARLLLLSPSSRHPQGLGNDSNAVGSTLTMHHGYLGQFDLDTRIFSGRAGPLTAASYQFLRPEARGRHGTALFAFNSSLKRARLVGDFGISGAADGPDVVRRTERMPYRRYLAIVCESVPSKKKYLTLSSQRDRFGDPFAHVHYEMNDFDRETHRYVKAIFGRMSHALRCTDSHMRPVERYGSVAHHMGTCPMGDSDADSVTNSFGQVYGSPNLFLGGGAIFPGGNGAVNPTLTMVALALRTAEFIADQFNVLANRKS
jgi:choline dehydrogenase-like flavoprotein